MVSAGETAERVTGRGHRAAKDTRGRKGPFAVANKRSRTRCSFLTTCAFAVLNIVYPDRDRSPESASIKITVIQES